MKPTNSKSESCDPVSSNCVIWQGPDLPCISLCKGDSVSDVVYNMAVELCKLQDMLTVDGANYDLSCFNLTSCAPSTFPKLLQFIMDRLCAVEQCSGCAPDCNGKTTPTSTTAASGCPDCEMTLAPCFQFTNGIGDTVTTLQMKDYITAIGNKICTLTGNTATNTTGITDLGNRVTNVEDNVTTLQDTQYIPPVITPVCVLPPTPTSMENVLTALETQFCNLQTATGTPTDLYLNIAKQCAGLNSSTALSPSGGPMSAIPGWSTTVSTLAESIGNLWLTICDMRSAIQNIQVNCCPTACSGITLSLFGIYESAPQIMNVVVNGTIPSGFTQCSGNTIIKISDSTGNSISVPFDLIGFLNAPGGFAVSLASTIINTALDLTIEIDPCLTDGTSTCESCLSYVYSNSPSCPVVTLLALETTVQYDFLTQAGNYTYTVELYDATGTILITSNTYISTAAVPVSGTLVGLGGGTVYKFRITVVPTSCSACPTVTCPFTEVETLPVPCTPPEDVTAVITWEPEV
jgi:hypothetical protein